MSYGCLNHESLPHPGNICCHTRKEMRYEVHVATASFHDKATVLAYVPKHYGCPL